MNYSDYRELITIKTIHEYNKKHRRHRKISYLEQWIICKKEVDEMLQRNGIKPPYKPKYYRTANHMANIADACIVFWDGKSKGTLDMINRAKAHNIQLRIVKYK